jgi:hypothetical protein
MIKNFYQFKNLFLIISLVLSVSSFSFAQNSFYGKVYYGISDANFLIDKDVVGLPGFDVEGFSELGFLLGKEINRNWAIEIGLNTSSADIKYRPNPSMVSVQGLTVLPPQERFKMLSFPILMRYSLFPFLYLNAGPILGFQRSENSFKSQSGIGYLLGIEAAHYFKKIGVFVHPHFKRHATIPFESNNFNLTEFGVQFGVGYTF